jgi:4-amino-4-deoxy-L-arabinose transferase-like glycosyltransferase
MVFPALSSPWRTVVQAVLLVVVSALVVWAPSWRKAPPMPAADAVGYLNLAYHIHQHGVFPDPGYRPTEVPQSGNMVAPLYPGMLSTLMALDTTFAARAECFLFDFYGAPKNCDASVGIEDWGSVLTVHRLLMVLALVLVWVSARVLSPHPVAPWLALGLAASSGVYGSFGQQILTESVTLPLTTAIGLCLALALSCKTALHKARALVGAAALCGVAALVRPTFSYVFYALILGVFLTALLHKPSRRMAFRVLMPMVVVYAAAVLPWMNRNDELFGQWALTGRYGGYILAQRVAYNAMDFSQWVASFLFWLPDFGDDLAAVFFSPDVLRPLDWYAADSFYVLGNGDWMRAYEQAAGGREALQGWLLKEKVLGDLGTHLAVTVPLALRGLWVGKYFGLIGLFCLLWVLISALRYRAWGWWVYCAPALFLVGLQAFVSVSIPRYNLGMVPCMAIAAAVLLVHGGQSLRRRIPSSLQESP